MVLSELVYRHFCIRTFLDSDSHPDSPSHRLSKVSVSTIYGIFTAVEITSKVCFLEIQKYRNKRLEEENQSQLGRDTEQDDEELTNYQREGFIIYCLIGELILAFSECQIKISFQSLPFLVSSPFHSLTHQNTSLLQHLFFFHFG